MSKVALITASSAGLGAAIAKALASDMRVVINYSSSRQRAESVLRELEQISPSHAEGKRHLALQADVSKRLEIVRLVDETVAAMGRLDVVVSNVGWTRLADFNDLDANVNEDDWDRCFNVNVKAHLFLMHAAKPYLEASEGAFISTASVAGVKPSGSSVAYAVTKAAQIHLAKSLAIIMSPKVRVNSVSPGIILTDWGLQFPVEKLEVAKAATKLQRFATVEDIALQVKVLALSQSVTGTNIVIDSGFSL